MRVLNLAIVAVFALIGSFGANAEAEASWKGSVFNTNTSAAPKAAPPARASRQRTTRRSSTSNSRVRNRTQAASRRTATASKNSAPRTSSRGGSLRGLASYYWQPQRVASGGWFNPNALTAAHKTLRFGTRVRVTNLNNGRSVVVRINDRGPYIRGRIIDLSKRAATVVGMTSSGVVPVRVDVL